MATMGNEKLVVKCRCCLKYGHHNDLTEPYETGVREVHSKMFLDCFNLVLSTSTELTNFICSSCIHQLNNALEFKTMVAESERQLLSEIGSHKTVSSKSEELGLHSELDIKFEDAEEANEESQHCSMDFDDAVNDNGTLNWSFSCKPDYTYLSPNLYITINGAQEEEHHVAVVSQEHDVRAWSFDNTVGKEEVKTEDETEEDMNRHSAASNVREGSPPTKGACALQRIRNESKPNLSPLTPTPPPKPIPLTPPANRWSRNSRIRFGFVEVHKRPTKLVLKKNGTSEKHQTVEHIAADIASPSTSNGTINYIPNRSDKTNIIYQTDEDKDNQTVISMKIYDEAVIVTDNELLDNIEAQDKREKAKKYSCTTCKYTTDTASLLKSHLQAHAAVRSYICDSCCYIATTKQNIIKHLKLHIVMKPFACKKCDKKFTVRSKLIRHVRVHTGDKPFACEMCDRKFAERASLNSHLRIHTGEKPFACEICDRKFSIRAFLKIHLRIHTGEKPYACEICDRKFSQKSTLNSHLRIHTGEKPFACEICDKKFSVRSGLNSHLRIHTGRKSFGCEICDRKFSLRAYLNNHLRIHSGEKPFACKICDKKFSQRANLNTHLRIHSGENPFACKICDKKFLQRASLNNHLRIHTGEKPFACKICDKKFSRREHLNSHVKIHTGEKPFACEICDRKFSRRDQLNIHHRIHTGEKPFACEMCDKRFRHKITLNCHVKTHLR